MSEQYSYTNGHPLHHTAAADAIEHTTPRSVGIIQDYEAQVTGEDVPLLQKDTDQSMKQTPIQASLTMIKAVVGAGSFGLPYGFAQAGLWGGMVGLTLLGILSGYTIKILVECKNKIGFNRPVSYVEVAEKALGKAAAIMVYVAICATSLGACSGYFIFCGSMLNEMFPQISAKYFILMMAVPLIPLTWLRSYKHLAFTAILGDIALLIGVVTVLVVGFQTTSLSSPFDTSRYDMWNWSTYPEFFGMAAFLFCIHMLVIPVEQNMLQPRLFNRTILGSFITVTILNMAFAALCYMMWDANTKPIVISNIGTSGAILYIARFALVIDLFFTFLVVFVPAREIIENSILKQQNVKHLWRCVIRTVLVALSAGIAIFVGNFETMIGLVSGMALSITAFILPPTIRFSLSFPKDKSYTPLYIAIDFVIFVFGLFAAFATTYMSLMNLLKYYGIDVCRFLPQTWDHCPAL